jgi:hypothetical protein
MKTNMLNVRHAALLVSVLAMAIPAAAQPLRIDGVGPLAPLSLAGVTPAVTGQRLEIRAGDGAQLSVQPWPAFLPQRFMPQTVQAERRALPAGPSDRLSFTRPAARQPWLVIGSGSRSATPLVGDWRLGRDGQSWEIVGDGAARRWQPGQALRVIIAGQRWCLYLLDAGGAMQRRGIADESEAQASWAALRTEHDRPCRPER